MASTRADRFEFDMSQLPEGWRVRSIHMDGGFIVITLRNGRVELPFTSKALGDAADISAARRSFQEFCSNLAQLTPKAAS